MLKNKLYPYVEKYINEYLYGFTKEQLDVGLTNGTISLEYLNLRPDKVNSKLDEKNLPIWLKAGLISKISVGLSLMNFIGEQPLDVTIDGIDVIVTPSYKWIIKNLESFIEENETHIKDYYDPNENNSIDIFTKKVNIFDNSIFKQQVILHMFSIPAWSFLHNQSQALFLLNPTTDIFSHPLHFFLLEAFLFSTFLCS